MQNENLNTAYSPAVKSQRPIAITVICILGFIGTVLGLIGLLLGSVFIAAIGGTMLLIWSIVSVLVGLVALIGMWKMKKWGAYLYAALFVIGQVVFLVIGAWSLGLSFFIGLAVTLTALYYSKQMN